MILRPAKLRKLHRALLHWYALNKRPLAWRKTNSPYRILVSEIMLQQTQVDRVQRTYPLFLKEFPSLRSLVRTSTADLIRSWQGMGYNLRALRLKKIAQKVAENFGGRIPQDIGLLQSLPGIGRYTAHAIVCFAFNQAVPVVDVNVNRVLSRVFWRMKGVSDRKEKEAVWKLAHQILPEKNFNPWNQGLMDLGATVCTAKRPLCSRCPVGSLCASARYLSHRNGKPSEPVPREKLYDGIPIRMYRGRIVENLRRENAIEISRLGKLIKSGFNRVEIPWLNAVLRKLTSDGLVELRKRKKRIFARLPRT